MEDKYKDRNKEMSSLIESLLEEYKEHSYNQLARWVTKGYVITPEVDGFQIEIQAMWDDMREGDIRVCGFISSNTKNHRWSLTRNEVSSCFIRKRDGTLV